MLTTLGTVVVVVLELVLLVVIYQRPDHVEEQRRVVAAAESSVVAGSAAGGLALADRLDALGADGDVVGPLRSPAAAADPARAVADVEDVLAEQRATVDRESLVLFAGLLTVASVGWTFWFRRLVGRHRRLQRELTEQQTRADSERWLAGLVRNSADLVLVCRRDATTTFATPSAVAVVGVPAASLVGGRWTDLVHPEDRPVVDAQLLAVRGEPAALALRLRHDDGRTLNAEGTATTLSRDGEPDSLVVTVRDVTERVRLAHELTHHAFHDPLTGLHNRRLLVDRLDHALAARVADDAPVALLFCDLDDFKEVNDRYGHRVGDLVLAEVGRRLAGTVRAGDTAARLGGDEFAVLMERTDLVVAHHAAARVQDALREPVVVEGEVLSVAVSIGLAPGVPGRATGEEVLRNADVAMYLAKHRGTGLTATYEPHLHTAARARVELREELRTAIDEGGLVLHYQPTVALPTAAVVGFEALVRWQHPRLGLLPPGRFVPLAEESGLVVDLGSWVLREACRAAVSLGTPEMSVNIAPQQLSRPEFLAEVTETLAASGLPADRLVLEITERVVLEDVAAAVLRLQALRALGVRIAIDDFGTGYSSLSYLDRLPLDVIKVDKSFVDSVTQDGRAATVTRAIIAMGRAMGLQTVAEGVEHEDQASWLVAADCARGQGYLWSQPVELPEARRMLAAGVALPADGPGSGRSPAAAVTARPAASPTTAAAR